jgi:hypothetical protein
MTIDRRDFFKLGAGGATTVLAGCGGGSKTTVMSNPDFNVGISGLCLIETRADHTCVIHMLDSTKLGIPQHFPVLTVALSQIDQDATSLDPTSKNDVGTSRETWTWDLSGEAVSIFDDGAAPDLSLDPTHPVGPKPPLNNWNSMKWIPNLNQWTGATTLVSNASTYITAAVMLRHGRIHGAAPKSRIGSIATWTVNDPNGNTITSQAFSDTAMLTIPLHQRTPAIKIGSGKVVLTPGKTVYALLQNDPAATPITPGSYPITLGHFDALYTVVEPVAPPTVAVDPSTITIGSGEEGDPVFCPPAYI